MKVAAITITFNRLDLTKKTIESFYQKTSVDYHLFVDNYSTDGTQEWIKQYDHIQLEKNYGIAYAFTCGVNALEGYDYILKLDNDIETVTDDIIAKMLKFFELNGNEYVASPTDLLLDPNFAPRILGKSVMNGYNVEFVTHTGGAFQLIPIDACKKLCHDYNHLARGDWSIGGFFTSHGYKPVYLRDFEMRHIGLNQSTPGNQYIMMSSKTELKRIIKEQEVTIKRLQFVNEAINKKLIIESEKNTRLLNAVHEGAAIVEKLQNTKWWQIWK